MGARHLWPLVATEDKTLQYEILTVKDEMSQRKQSANSMADYVVRYENALEPLYEILRKDAREHVVAPAVDKLLQGGSSYEDSTDAFLKPSARDLVIGVLCNLTLFSKKFSETILQNEQPLILQTIRQHLSPLHWKTGSVNLLCNLVGKQETSKHSNSNNFLASCCEEGGVVDVLLDTLEKFLAVDCGNNSSSSSEESHKNLEKQLHDLLAVGGAAGRAPSGKKKNAHQQKDVLQKLAEEQVLHLNPNRVVLRDQFLGALLNLAQSVVPARLSVAKRVNSVLLPVLRCLEGEPLYRTLSLLQKCVLSQPTCIDAEMLEELVRVLGKSFAFATSNYEEGSGGQNGVDLDSESALKFLEVSARLAATLLTKSQAFEALFLLAYEQQGGHTSEGGPSSSGSCASLKLLADNRAFPLDALKPAVKTMIKNLVKIVCLLRPREYVSLNEQRTWAEQTQSKVRGNLALLFAHLVQLENSGGLNFGLGGTVEVFIDYLRKDREGAQTNSGVVVTKMAMSERYRELVRLQRVV